MNTENTEHAGSDAADSPQESILNPMQYSDGILQMIAAMALDGVSLPITVNVGGLLVCGETMSGKDYMRQTTDQLKQRCPDEVTANYFESAFEQFAAPYENLEDLNIGFLHMKNVSYHSAAVAEGVPNGASVKPLWRGRISQIDGFNFGRLGVSHPSQS
ncbi:hypothetical protein D7Y39_15955 [Stenotrophomonas maltophilia]|uniref:hypothetical protein n=1 Tax=Stenotrophomonas maltophilia TaxID=40324 RepID=UPI0015E0594A|nr:hypothetical protein [Stenotrophomonas maltophilia]MBA0291303.1 hypothetical protein [Stenotrophomonas maltophilia]